VRKEANRPDTRVICDSDTELRRIEFSMRSSLPLLVLLVAAASANAQLNDPASISCVVPHPRIPELTTVIDQGSAAETQRMHASPHEVKRVGKHQIDVAWSSGKRTFRDKPPYDDPLAGVWWAYCGYNPVLKMHLLYKAAGDNFTGMLMDDVTGKLLPGGEKVLFSPDRKQFLAYEQPDGQDGQTLKLYDHSGNLVWQGYNGILSPDRKTVVAEFTDISWHGSRLVATASFSEKKKISFTLVLHADSSREWVPELQQ
jgi:hypothetical protein